MTENMIKVSLIGAPKTGKTAYARRWLTGDFKDEYHPTDDITCYPFTFGDYDLKVMDGMKNYLLSDAAIAFYTPETISETDKIVEDFKKQCPNALVVNVWSFIDLQFQEQVYTALARQNKILRGGRKSWCFSSKSNYNFDKPFLEIMRFVSQNETWNFPPVQLPAPVITPK